MGVVCERGRGVLGLDLGVLQRKGLEAVLAGAQQPRDARLQVVRGSRAKLRRARLPQRVPRRAGGVAPVGDQTAWNGYLAGAAREGRRSGGGPRRARRRTRRSSSGLSAEHAGGAHRLSGLRLPGAVWSSCSPDFGLGSVVDRFTQIEPKVLFAVDGYRYGGKDYDRME